MSRGPKGSPKPADAMEQTCIHVELDRIYPGVVLYLAAIENA